jgi:hypothetical protein
MQLIPHDQGETIIYDSLPYIEKDLIHPDYEAYAISLIDQEMQWLPMKTSLNNPLIHEIPLFGNLEGSSINKNEYSELLERGGTVTRPNPIDFNKTHVAVMEPIQSSGSDETDLASWQNSLRSAKIELEYQRNRLINLELQAEFEPDLWKYHNSILESHQSHPIQKASESQRNIVDKMNAKRKYQQESEMGPKLRILERKWSELIETNQQLVTAMKLLEDEVGSLRATVGEIQDEPVHEQVAFMEKDDDYYED